LHGQGHKVKFSDKGIEFEGPTEDLQRLFKTFEKGQNRSGLAGDPTTDAPPPKKK
jgi:hypothetical protein